MSEDLKLISGDFLSELPIDKKWLLTYFKNEILQKFLLYYMNFPRLRQTVSNRAFCQLFIDHTGFDAPISSMLTTMKKVGILEKYLLDAEKSKNLECISNIKMGKARI